MSLLDFHGPGRERSQKIWVFFYGSYINRAVLMEVDLVPETFEMGRVMGFDLRLRPRANLVRSDRDLGYGMLAIDSFKPQGDRV